MEHGWRTLYVENAEKLRLKDGCIAAGGENSVEIPLEQLRMILLDSPQTTVSAALLAECCGKQIPIILCDTHRQPVGEVLAYPSHFQASGHLSEQIGWSEESKAQVWQAIIRNKLRMQGLLLERKNGAVPAGFYRCLVSVLPNDSDNREGIAARMYFHALFGSGFRRFSADETNAALNYGYAILRSAMGRLIAVHGYQAALGVHHHSAENPRNLACDLMEPFRPLVDEIVSVNQGKALDRDYKQLLIGVQQTPVLYRGFRYTVYTAMERLLLDSLSALSSGKCDIGEVCFLGKKNDTDAVL